MLAYPFTLAFIRARGITLIQPNTKCKNDLHKNEESARVGKLTYLSGALQRQAFEVGTIRTARTLSMSKLPREVMTHRSEAFLLQTV